MSIHRPSHRWEDVAIVFMATLVAVIIFLIDG